MTAASEDERLPQALLELDAITRRLRRECPWDREQDERSIVPHTVEEAYELADAAHSGDDAKLLDELGDVLFQVYFLALLLEERGHGDLADGGGGNAREAGPPPPAHLRRARRWPSCPTDATHALRGEAELGRDQAARGPRHARWPKALPALTFARKRLQARVRARHRGSRAPHSERVARAREAESR